MSKIGYIVLCHKDSAFIEKLAIKLRYRENRIFIAIDNKVDKSPFVKTLQNFDNIQIIDNKLKNYWGGWNSVRITIETFKIALNSGDFDRFIILQGQDYPLYSNDFINDFFDDFKEIEFCRAFNISQTKDKKQRMKIQGFWYMDNTDNLFGKVIKGVLGRINKLDIPYRKSYINVEGKRFDIWGGWAHMALTRRCVEYIVDFYYTHRKFNQYFSHRFPPDEMYFHTIIYNSKFKKYVIPTIINPADRITSLCNVTYFEYPVEVINFVKKEDYKKLMDSGFLFARKINSNSSELIEEIDNKASLYKYDRKYLETGVLKGI